MRTGLEDSLIEGLIVNCIPWLVAILIAYAWANILKEFKTNKSQ